LKESEKVKNSNASIEWMQLFRELRHYTLVAKIVEDITTHLAACK
jgi:hypothetical protein